MSFECHITLELPDEAGRQRLTEFLEDWGWKASWIDGDPLLGEKRFFYLTRHSDSYSELYAEMQLTAKVVSGLGFVVVRKKIEEIIYDTKKELLSE
jgi:hypothetical protein